MAHVHEYDSTLPGYGHTEHGARCDCLLLADALHVPGGAVTFSFCRHVLQKRYAMSCTHGEAGPVPQVVKACDLWRESGELDAVKAILLTNA